MSRLSIAPSNRIFYSSSLCIAQTHTHIHTSRDDILFAKKILNLFIKSDGDKHENSSLLRCSTDLSFCCYYCCGCTTYEKSNKQNAIQIIVFLFITKNLLIADECTRVCKTYAVNSYEIDKNSRKTEIAIYTSSGLGQGIYYTSQMHNQHIFI